MYKYKHENGQTIEKTDYVVNSMGSRDYFNSPFVKYWWHVDDKTGKTDSWSPNFINSLFEEE